MGNFYSNQAAAICMFLNAVPSIGPTYTDLLKELTTLIFGNTDITVELTKVKKTLSELRKKSAKLPPPGSPTDENSFIMNHFKNELSPQLQRDVIVELFEFCRKELDKQRHSRDQVQLPWRYAVIAFGSTARFEATPNSDFEWGILVDDDGSLDSDCRKYFRELTTLFHFLVICLGETILPAMAIKELEAANFFDKKTVRGFAFDGLMPGACKWPLGNQHHHDWDLTASEAFELIGRPTDLAKFQSADDYKNRPEFAFSLLSARFICGDQSLFDEYRQDCTQMIRSHQDSIRSSIRKLLREDCERYRFRALSMNSFGVFLSPKNLYRLFDRSVLALWFLEQLSDQKHSQELLVVSLSTVELLEQVSCLHKNGKANIRDAIQWSLLLRLQTHHAQHGRDMLPATVVDHIKLITQYYRVAIPFGDKLYEVLESASCSLDPLKSENFVFDDTNMLEAIVEYRLARFPKCKALLEQAAKGNNETERLRKWYLVHVNLRLRNLSAVVKQFDELLKVERDPDMKTRMKVCQLNALYRMPASKRLNDLEEDLRKLVFDASTTADSTTRAALELLRYYQLFNMVGKEQSLLAELVQRKRHVVDRSDHLSTWYDLDWSNKDKVIEYYRDKQERLHRLYAGEASFLSMSITKFLRYCIRHDCIDAVGEQIAMLKAKSPNNFAKLVIVNFEFFQALKHQNWYVARDRLVEWDQLLKSGEDWMKLNHFQALLQASKLNFHLKKNGSCASPECEQDLHKSIKLWNSTPMIEKCGSDWGDLILFIGEIQRERGQLVDAFSFLAAAHWYYCTIGDKLKVAIAASSLRKTNWLETALRALSKVLRNSYLHRALQFAAMYFAVRKKGDASRTLNKAIFFNNTLKTAYSVCHYLYTTDMSLGCSLLEALEATF